MKHKNAITRVRKYFPQVTEVRDAKETLLLTVKKQDATGARRKDPTSCALAKACIRQEKVDGAIINIGYSWLIKGNVAERYHTSVTVSREITSFDRHSDFAAGRNYRLSAPSPSSRLGRKRPSGPSGKHTGHGHSAKQVHHTNRIRVAKLHA